MGRKPRATYGTPSLRAFGNQVRHYRERLGLSQERLAERWPISGSYIGLVENGKSRCTEEFVTKLDIEVKADGALVVLWDDLVKHIAAHPDWFDWPPIERDSVCLRAFHPVLVWGLLQTEAYSRAVLQGDEAAVAARVKRQEILTREDPRPPMIVCILDEAVLHHDFGGPEVMREQLEHLIALVSPRVRVHIVPSGIVHPGNVGGFVLATLEDRSELGYAETAVRGLTTGARDDIRTLTESYETIPYALPQGMSIDLIRRTVEERWT